MSTAGITSFNRTGITRDLVMAKAMADGAKDTDDGTDTADFLRHRREEQLGKPPVATMPAPANARVASSPALLDKLGERLAFERAGVRLYETLLLKHDTHGSYDGGPTADELRHIRSEEAEHFALLERTIARMGGDPTSVTPGANLVAVETKGIAATILDARTTLAEGLHAVLIAELADHAGWEQLVELAQQLSEHELAREFEHAREHEEDHLRRVKEWLAADLALKLEPA